MSLPVNHIHAAFTPLYDEMEKHAGMGTWIYDKVSGTCSFSRNFCRIAGMSRQHPFSRFNDLAVNVHPDDRYLLTQTTQSLLANQPMPECEYRITGGARTRFVRQYGKTLRNADDAQQTFGFWQDITRWRIKDDHLVDLLHTENALKQKNRELGLRNMQLQAFSYIIGHDFKEPIARIYTAIELLLSRGGQSKENDRKYLRQMQVPLQHMRLLADDIAQFSGSADTGPSFKPVDLNQVLAQALKRLEGQVKHAAAVIDVPLLSSCQGNFSMLSNLFQRIIGNAIASRQQNIHPVIVIREAMVSGQDLAHENVVADANYLMICVSDNSGRRDTMFAREEFTLCEKIAVLHGGFLTVQSSSAGGTIVCCYLQQRLSQ